MQRSHFALDRNELLNIGHKRIAVIKEITKPTKQKQSKAVRPKPLAVPKTKAES